MKVCSKCKQEKGFSEFSSDKQKKDGFYSSCKSCAAIYYRSPQRKEKAAKYRATVVRKNKLKTKYGLSLDDYQFMYASQGGLCKICSSLSNPNKRLCVDHNHKNGKVRGLLCDQCNTGIGQFKDSPTLLKKAMEYVQGS